MYGIICYMHACIYLDEADAAISQQGQRIYRMCFCAVKHVSQDHKGDKSCQTCSDSECTSCNQACSVLPWKIRPWD